MKNDSDKKWYLPFFITKMAKSRVVYDGAATAGGESLNRAVLVGENLLNGLVDVLMRFRMGKYACVANVSKCAASFKLSFLGISKIGSILFGSRIVTWTVVKFKSFALLGRVGNKLEPLCSTHGAQSAGC